VADYTNASLTAFVKELAKKYLNKTASQLPNLKCGYACSDHARWHNAGVPTVYPFETSFNEHNRKIHTSGDTFASVNVEHAMAFVRLAVAYVIEMGKSH
jgi:leucyl aminopeptidase